MTIDLSRVAFTGRGLSAGWVEDRAGGSEAAPDPIESDASIHLAFRNVTVSGTGFAEDEAQSCRALEEEDGCSWADFDGMRFNEGGLGDITFDFRSVDFSDSAGDGGVDLDEVGNGDACFGASGVVATGNVDENIEVTESDPEEGIRARGATC